jgi:hypothetical protein
MSSNRYINTRFWEDNYIYKKDSSEKLLFIYLLTNSQTNIAGVYEVNLEKAARETGIDREMIEKLIDRFTTDKKVYYVEGYIILRNFLRHQSLNPSVKKGIIREINALPERIRKLYLINDDGLYFDARELAGTKGGSIELLTNQIDKLWISMQTPEKSQKTQPTDDRRTTFNRGRYRK